MSTKQTPEEVEEVKDLEQVEEVQDLIEAPEEVKEVQDLAEAPEEVKAPALRGGGLRGAADPNMIQKHIDNFLAMLCGETPVDSNVRTSAEYWLKRLATGEGEGSTKKIYWHNLRITRSGSGVAYIDGFAAILNNDSTAITVDALVELIKTPGFVLQFTNGRYGGTNSDPADTNCDVVNIQYKSDTQFTLGVILDSTHAYTEATLNITGLTVVDMGANAIN